MRLRTASILVLILTATSALASEAPSILGVPEGSSVRLGDSIHQLVFQLGPPDYTSLAGETDGYYTPSPGDALVLTWNGRECQFGPQACSYSAFFESGSAVLSRFTVYLASESRPPVATLGGIVGPESRLVRFPLILDSDELEAQRGTCTSEKGEAQVLVVPELGLDAALSAGHDTVEVLDFSTERRLAGWPKPCEP